MRSVFRRDVRVRGTRRDREDSSCGFRCLFGFFYFDYYFILVMIFGMFVVFSVIGFELF